jgi:hypothetical protein
MHLANLINNPCSAEIVPGVYAGEQGFTSRFVSDLVLSATVGYTCGVVIYHPSSGNVHASGAAASSSATTIAYAASASYTPGYGTTNTVASKQRAVAACITTFASSASATTLTGELVAGVCSLDTLPQGSSLTFDSFFSLGSMRAALEKKTVDVKWFPNTLDDRYTTCNTLTGADVSDTNVIFMAFRGYPAALGVSVRLTGVIEWTPKIGVGVASSNNVNAEPVNHNAVVGALQRKNPSWWHTMGENLKEDSLKAARYVGQAALSFGAQRASQYFLTAAETALMIA